MVRRLPVRGRIAAALIWQADTLLLVQQQGPADPAPYWALPGGRLEPGETLEEGLAREMQEETGLTPVALGPLAYMAELEAPALGYRVTTHMFEVAAWRGKPAPADPDRLVNAVAFFPVAEAVARLRQIPWAIMREPAVAYLRQQVLPGTHWLYRQSAATEEQRLVRREAGGAATGEKTR